ncbi:MAG: hypothetical protein J6B81_05790 [Spirochaetaceae bacterium]|nr:hypothetical protein [Spirochaetaceae bacterium]
MEALHSAGQQRCSAFYSENVIEDFHHFAELAGIEKCALLVPFGKRFFMQYSHGFDADTIFKSISTSDFWNGTCPNAKDWRIFKGSSLEPFYQLFSEQEKNKLEYLQIKTFVILADVPLQAILLIADSNLSHYIQEPAIHKLAEVISSDAAYNNNTFSKTRNDLQNAKKFKLDISKAINGVAKDFDYEAKSILCATVESELIYQLNKILPKDDFCFIDEQENVNIFFFNAKTMDNSLLQFMLQKFFYSFLDKNAEMISVEQIHN